MFSKVSPALCVSCFRVIRSLRASVFALALFRGSGPWAKFRFENPADFAESFMMSSATGLDALAAAAAGDLEMEENLDDVSVEVDDLDPPKGTGKVELQKTFEFGPSLTTAVDLDNYSGLGWFARNLVRPSEGEVEPKPKVNEAVVSEIFSWLVCGCLPAGLSAI